MQTFIRIHPKDSVAVALQPLSNGTVIRLDDLQFTPEGGLLSPGVINLRFFPYRRAKRSLKIPSAPIGTAIMTGIAQGLGAPTT